MPNRPKAAAGARTARPGLKGAQAGAPGSTAGCGVTCQIPPRAGQGRQAWGHRHGNGTTTHARHPRAPMGSIRLQRRGNPTGGALPLMALYIAYHHLGRPEKQRRKAPCHARGRIVRLAGARGQGLSDQFFMDGRSRGLVAKQARPEQPPQAYTSDSRTDRPLGGEDKGQPTKPAKRSAGDDITTSHPNTPNIGEPQ